MINIGIVGGAGYTAGELIRLLINHPKVNIDFIYSRSFPGEAIGTVHQDLIHSNLKFNDTLNPNVDILFLCLGHGHSRAFLEKFTFNSNCRIIDLSNDFRLQAKNHFNDRTFIYGLPEFQKKKVINAQNIANPGCFATAIQLAILPLANKSLITDNIHVNAVTGATGAGTSLTDTTHFTWRDNNFSSYKPFTHQHLGEITESINTLQPKFNNDIIFVPNRGNFSRGIFASVYTRFEGSHETALAIYHDFYKEALFTVISEKHLHLKQVVNTNFAFIQLIKHKDILLILTVIDNLLKGASGQAVQNMNLMMGYKEDCGLNLKSTYF